MTRVKPYEITFFTTAHSRQDRLPRVELNNKEENNEERYITYDHRTIGNWPYVWCQLRAGPDGLLSNGDYLAVGENGNGTPGVVVEFSSTGVLQSTVTPGTVVAALSSSQGGESPTIFQPNGDYIVAWTTATNHDLTTSANVARFSETGTQDCTFSSFPFTFGGEKKSSPTAIALQANGQVVVGGAVNGAAPIYGGLARLDSNGDLDTTFGSGGTLTLDNSVSGLLMQTDGKIVAVEQVSATGIVVARYLAN